MKKAHTPSQPQTLKPRPPLQNARSRSPSRPSAYLHNSYTFYMSSIFHILDLSDPVLRLSPIHDPVSCLPSLPTRFSFRVQQFLLIDFFRGCLLTQMLGPPGKT